MIMEIGSLASLSLVLQALYTIFHLKNVLFKLLQITGESEMNAAYCESRGCVWDGIAKNIKCHLPLDGSKSYGYEVLFQFVF